MVYHPTVIQGSAGVQYVMDDCHVASETRQGVTANIMTVANMRNKDDYKQYGGLKTVKRWVGVLKYQTRNNRIKWQETDTDIDSDAHTQFLAQHTGFPLNNVVGNLDAYFYVDYKAFDNQNAVP